MASMIFSIIITDGNQSFVLLHLTSLGTGALSNTDLKKMDGTYEGRTGRNGVNVYELSVGLPTTQEM